MKDLCARVPYGVKYVRSSWNYDTDQELPVIETLECAFEDGYINHSRVYTVYDIEPYLFPLSSMTEKQMDKVEEILMGCDPKIIFDFMSDGDIIFKKGNISIKAFIELTQYFDKEMLDYRGLIPMGLAEDCTNLNIY